MFVHALSLEIKTKEIYEYMFSLSLSLIHQYCLMTKQILSDHNKQINMLDVTIGYLSAILGSLVAEVRNEMNEFDCCCTGFESRQGLMQQ